MHLRSVRECMGLSFFALLSFFFDICVDNMDKLRKGLTVAVILLFIGLAFAPSINANISKEMVEFTTEVCGLDGGKQTVKLTQEEAKEVDVLFSSIRERLNATDSREEAEEIFKEAVVELHKYGLLGGLSINKAQRLVCGGYQNQYFKRIFEKEYNENIVNSKNANYLCLISGKSDITFIIGPFTILTILHLAFLLVRHEFFLNQCWEILNLISEIFGIYKLCDLISNFIEDIVGSSWHIRGRLLLCIAIYSYFFPLKIGSIITYGLPNFDPWGSPKPSSGKIVTFGLNGNKVWNGEFYGDIYPFIGVVGFSGIKISNDYSNASYFGFASRVKIHKTI